MTREEHAKCFFPGNRKEVRVEGITLLRNTAEETRIKLALRMPLDDGKLVGMPSWVAEALERMGAEDSVEQRISFDLTLDGMTLRIHETTESKRPAQTVASCLLKSMAMARDIDDADSGDDEVSISLTIVAYLPATEALWTWFYRYLNMRLFVLFEPSQDSIGKPKQMPLVGDKYDGARREANNKKHDSEFAGVTQ